MLEFVQTLEIMQHGDWYIVLQEYWDDKKEISIYNIAIELLVTDGLSRTIDIYENKNLNTATKEYRRTIKNFKKAHDISVY